MNDSIVSGTRPIPRLRASIRMKRCAHCDRTFSKEEHLKRHERSHTGERPFKCHKCHKRYARSDVLARHLQTHPDRSANHRPQTSATGVHLVETTILSPENDVQCTETNATRLTQGTTVVLERHILETISNGGDAARPTYQERPLASQQEHSSILTSLQAADSYNSVSILPATHNQGSSSTEPNDQGAQDARAAVAWHNALHEDTHEVSQQSRLPSARPPEASNEGGSTLSYTEDDEDLPVMPETDNLYGNRSGIPVWQRSYDGSAELSQPTAFTSGSNRDRMLSYQLAGSDRHEQIEFMFGLDFAPTNYLSPGVTEFLDFGVSRTPLSAVNPANNATSGSSHTFFSVDQMQRMRHLWQNRRRVPGARIVRSLWHDIIRHEADNIFSSPVTGEGPHAEALADGARESRWGIDSECRERLYTFCRSLDDKNQYENLAELTPRSMSGVLDLDPGQGSSSTLFFVDGYPTKEVLEASLDLFFRRCPLDFIHKATFDAKAIPESLLLAIFLVGFSLLYPERSKPFVVQYRKVLIHFCRIDLISRMVDCCHVSKLLVTMATTLLLVYLGLDYMDQLEEGKSHMLCIQMLHIAEKHGLLAASDGDDPQARPHGDATDSDGSWKAWCRVESIKRMICCLLWMDMAYARVMGGAGVLEIEKVELYLPNDNALFEAPSSSRFLQIVPHDVCMEMPRILVRDFRTDLSPVLNHMAMETLLVALYLRIAAIRHKIPIGCHQSDQTWSVVSEDDFLMDSETAGVIMSLLSLPSRSVSLFQQRHRVTAFAWNNVCISLTADLNLLEIASGRDGIEEAQAAMLAVHNWSQTPRARRASLHAAQIFDILSSSRLTEWNIARPDLLLFHSGLVLSMYIFVRKPRDDENNGPALELLQNIDWIAVGREGLPDLAQRLSSRPIQNEQCSPNAMDGVRNFIRNSGLISFAGDILGSGSQTARKILLNYVHLLDEIGKHRGSSYSQILRTMSDFVIQSHH